MFPKVVQVIPMQDYSVYVYFEDGKIVHYDMSRMIEKEAFHSLKDIGVFMETCTVMNDTLAWDINGNRDNTKCQTLTQIHYMNYLLQMNRLLNVRDL